MNDQPPPQNDHRPPGAPPERAPAPARLTFKTVTEREREQIDQRRSEAGLGPVVATGAMKGPTGLSLSGGGIRAACFSLGFLEALDRLPSPRAAGGGNAPPRPPGPATGDPGTEGGRGDSPREPADPGALAAGGPGVGAGGDKSPPKVPPPGTRCLEEFDYVSAVSGGGYALGHLVTAMLGNARLGDLAFTSKTVPGWLWGTGVFFLGVAFQLLKTGTLLVAFLATLALLLRSLDAPDAMRFCSALGLNSDISRGFAPFWLTLWIFLTGYGIESTRHGRAWTRVWFCYAVAVIASYLVNVWLLGPTYPDVTGELGFGVQFLHLVALFLPPLVMCLAILARQFPRLMPLVVLIVLGTLLLLSYVQPLGFMTEMLPGWGAAFWGLNEWHRLGLLGGAILVIGATSAAWLAARATKDEARQSPGLRLVLLVPLLMALFCLAGLVTTGDVGVFMNSDDPLVVEKAQEASARYGRWGDQLYWYLWAALGLTSLGLFFPTKLFKSERLIESGDAGGERQAEKRRRWGREPVYRVIVFLCSYGFVLLVVFVVYSTVAAENVSGYFTWRENMSVPALHIYDFRNWDRAWQKIDRDADPRYEDQQWSRLARKLMDARRDACFSIEEERRLATALRMHDALPWGRRLAGLFVTVPMPRPWNAEHPLPPFFLPRLAPERVVPYADAVTVARPKGAGRLGVSAPERAGGGMDEKHASTALSYNIRRDLQAGQQRVVLATSKVLRDAKLVESLGEDMTGDTAWGLWEAIPAWLDSFGSDAMAEERDAARAKAKRAWELETEYRRRAESLNSRLEVDRLAAGGSDAAYLAAVSNNNRKALQLYLGDLMYQRRDNVVFAGIVWAEDQWRRTWIAASAGVLWVLCCVVNPNTFSLQKFYRRHVIDSWVKGGGSGGGGPWLDEARDTRDYGGGRAPIPLFNATREENRSLGHEPDLPNHIFTFSPFAAGYGTAREEDQKYWEPQEGSPKEDFARDNNLDVGNIAATSGAFLSPGTVANPALSALLHLLNVQTGYWAHPPGALAWMGMEESFWFHVCQSLGIDKEDDNRFMLTDGAHVENLGLYSLLVRRCRLIVAADCSQEDRGQAKDRRFNALVQVLQQAGSDGIQVGPFLNSYAFAKWKRNRPRLPRLGGDSGCERKGAVGLDLLLPEARDVKVPADDVAQEHYLFAELRYPGPEGGVGLLVYVRPTLTGDEGDGLLLAGRSTAFPDDDPVDQFYTPAKMNQYRLLGRHIAEELASDPVFLAELIPGLPPRAGKPEGEVTRDGTPCDWCSKDEKLPCLWRRPRAFRARAEHQPNGSA